MSKSRTPKKGKPKPIRKPEYGARAANIAGVVVLGTFAVLALLSILRIRIPLPEITLPAQLDSTAARVVMAFAALFALPLIGVAVFKAIEIRRARRWPSVPGRITISQHATERGAASFEGEGIERTVARVEFEYVVAGKLYASRRVTMGEIVSGDDIAPLLARYPVGARVMVHYPPDDPANGVVEREAPEGMLRGCLIALAIGVAATMFLMRVVTEGPGFLMPVLGSALPEANLPVLLFFLLPAAIVLIAAGAMARATLKVRRWPIVQGEILSTGVRRSGGSGGGARLHRPLVRYRYAVGDRSYESSAIEHGMETSGGEGWARGVIARYPVGATVDVRYDPADPARSALSVRFGVLGWALVAIVALLLGGALLASGLV